MRQEESLDFVQLMARMRVDALTNDDKLLLKIFTKIFETDKKITMKEVALYYAKISKDDPHVLALFPTNDEVNLFNEVVANYLGAKFVTIEADDSTTINKYQYCGKRRIKKT